MYNLTKFLSLLIYPIGSTFLLFAFAVALYIFRYHRRALAVNSFAIAWLWIWSMPVTSDVLRGSLESRYQNIPVESVLRADAAVILGGAFISDPSWPYPTATSSVNRYWHGARLYHAGRVETVLLTGGRNPQRPENLTEAQAGAIFMRDMGVPRKHTVLDNQARTTHQHVGYVAELLEDNGLESFLLVTSAMHMRRAEAVFRAGGLDPIPVATDFHVAPGAKFSLRRFLPSAGGLGGSTAAVHEYVGFWFYRLRGWI